MKGRFIAIEGIDGAGGQTQSKLLVNYLKSIGKDAVRLAYPDYSSSIGKIIYAFLNRKIELPVHAQFVLYLSDMAKDVKKIQKWLADGKWVIADRWFGSTLAYQCGKEMPIKVAMIFAKLLNIPKPELNIYLKISVDVSIKRKVKEKCGKIDRYEANRTFLEKVAKNYLALINGSVFGKWVVIDGKQTIEKVFSDIKNVLKITKVPS
jgi:dTMP kinase